MTLNDVMADTLRYFTEFGTFGADYVKMAEVRAVDHYACHRNVAQRIYWQLHDLR